jgi:cytochrome c553
VKALLRRFAWTAVVLGIMGGIAGLLVAASGVYSVSAERGHWPVTRRLLTFAMERSVAHHSRNVEAPTLDDPALIALGLGHYDGACAPCHGAPDSRRSPIALGAVPVPPFLPEAVPQWEPEELFWITRHGLKYTGMPAWPADQREDEVWAVVAGLLQLPGMSTDDYRRIVRGDRLRDLAAISEDAQLLATSGPLGRDLVSCARCHGLRGEGRGDGAFPPLAGQRAEYLEAALHAYATGKRQSGVMQPIATELTAEDMRELSRWFASLPRQTATTPTQRSGIVAELRTGEELARSGRPERHIPACAACHGPGPGERHPLYPSLAGLPRFYLEQQLRVFRTADYPATPQAEVMRAAARTLEEGDIRAVAIYYASLPPEPLAPTAPPLEPTRDRQEPAPPSPTATGAQRAPPEERPR